MKPILQKRCLFLAGIICMFWSFNVSACNFTPSFTYSSKIGCTSSDISFTNNTDTTGYKIKSYSWDFGDGTAANTTTYNPVHTYGPGKYTATITLKDASGCSGTYSETITITKPGIHILFKDTVCWATAKSSGINFEAQPQSGTVFYQWSFGDPNSSNTNVANYAWSANHKFVGGPGGAFGGPGIYYVSFTMVTASCGTLDTCFPVHIKGPMAVINLPSPAFPANDTIPALHIPKSAFIAINSSKSTCTADTIPYVTYTSTGTHKHYVYGYCNAKIKSEVIDSIGDCNGNHKIPFVASLVLKPTDSTLVTATDSVAKRGTWTKGNAIPAKAYYPPSGTMDWNTMNDTNLMTCRLPNLVRFTNNSIKWRLRYAIDDNTVLNVLSPANSYRDTCVWKNYPFASDSLTYYWQFHDPSGKPCTSSATNKNWDCNFSTLCAPYHYYRGTAGYPASGCETVSLSVSDNVTSCADSTTITLKQGPPNAYWDRSAYCKMTWEMQSTDLAPRGAPGTNGPPMIGFQFSNQANACTGANYPFRIDFSQTLPTCSALHWWAVFDSAATTRYKHCSNPSDSVLDYGFIGDPNTGYAAGKNGYPTGGPDAFWENIPWQGNYWYQAGDTGCKTIGIVLQVGQCYDTAWYHDYICFNKLDPSFNIYNGGKLIANNSAKRMDLDTGIACGSTGIAYKDHIWDQIYAIYAPGNPKHPATCPGSYAYAYHNLQFVDSSNGNGHGWICGAVNPYNTDSMGVMVYLEPKDTNQSDITSWRYSITRGAYYNDPTYSNNTASRYYNDPVWPDSATIYPFTTVNDSIAQVKQHVYYIDSTGGNPYIILHQPGLPTKRQLYNFPFYRQDIDSLLARGHVNIYLNDPRARRISATCGNYITVYAGSGLRVTQSIGLEALGGFAAADSFLLPYPGVYNITSTASNLEGCTQTAQYTLIYGHFAMFDAGGDSVLCNIGTVTFHPYIRYWSTNCPLPPGGGIPPQACLNGADDMNGMLSNSIDFDPWAYTNPTAYRDSLTSGNFSKNSSKYYPKGYQPEKWSWNFGDGFAAFVKTGIPIKHTYTKPGVYTVTMQTIDDRGCVVTTVRKNLIKVVQVVAKFKIDSLSDSLNYCGPSIIVFDNQSTIKGATYTDKIIKNGEIVDTTISIGKITGITFKPGDGSSIVKTGNPSNITYDYIKLGMYNVSLSVTSDLGCIDSIVKSKLVTLAGPQPKFEIVGSSSGCASFTVQTHFHASKSKNARLIVWKLGDAVKLPAYSFETTNSKILAGAPVDSLASLSYTQPGTYRLYVVETDTFRDKSGTIETCTDSFPHAGDSLQYWVHVYAADAHWKANLISGAKAAFTNDDLSNSSYAWDFGDGTTASGASPSHTFTAKGKYKVTCTAIDNFGCSAVFDSVIDFLSGIAENTVPVSLVTLYPNPFHESTVISYTLDEASGLKIELFDVAGKEIAIMQNGKEEHGPHQLEVNAQTYNLKPGVYMLKFSSGKGYLSQRLIVY